MKIHWSLLVLPSFGFLMIGFVASQVQQSSMETQHSLEARKISLQEEIGKFSTTASPEEMKERLGAAERDLQSWEADFQNRGLAQVQPASQTRPKIRPQLFSRLPSELQGWNEGEEPERLVVQDLALSLQNSGIDSAEILSFEREKSSLERLKRAESYRIRMSFQTGEDRIWKILPTLFDRLQSGPLYQIESVQFRSAANSPANVTLEFRAWLPGRP